MASSHHSKKPKKAFSPKLKQPSSQSPSTASFPITIHRDLQLAVWLNPNFDTHCQLGFAFYKSGYFTQAKEHFIKALTYNPKSFDAKWNLAITLKDDGDIDGAYRAFEEVYEFESRTYGSATILDEMISLQHFKSPLDMPQHMAVLKRYDQLFGYDSPIALTKLQPRTPLRVGFVSGDLREHPVGYFLESTLSQFRLDPALSCQLELVAYSNTYKQDDYTFSLSEHFDQWYRVDSWTDERLVDQIKRDRIDILVDLSGHTQLNRLPVFAKKPAPLQVSWLGYWASTGLSSMDYVIADPVSVPVGEEQWFSEKIWRLPSLRYCFSTPESAPEVSPPPCIQSQQVVFGCYQNVAKMNQSVLRCWSRILESSPHARLRIQMRQLKNTGDRERFIANLQAVGIDVGRVELIGEMNYQEYLTSYAKVDILLDTFPYPGGTTTAESLWMGVPTITLAMPSMLARQGEALMVNAGLSDWVARNEDEYVQNAIAWANADATQRQQLATLRINMREQVRLSPVFNAKQFAQEFVGAMYGMWQEKCAESNE